MLDSELLAWLFQGRPAFADPVAQLFESHIPLSALVLASFCGMASILFRRDAVHRTVGGIIAGLALLGVGFFFMRMVGYLVAGQSLDFDQLALGMSMSWQAVGIFFSAIVMALLSVLVGRVLEQRRLVREASRVR